MPDKKQDERIPGGDDPNGPSFPIGGDGNGKIVSLTPEEYARRVAERNAEEALFRGDGGDE